MRLFLHELIPYTFKVVLISFGIAVALDVLFPQMISGVIRLEYLLWAVILLGFLTYLIYRTDSH